MKWRKKEPKTDRPIKAHHIGGGAAVVATTTGHHLMSDWTVHGVLHEITHNGYYTAILAAIVLSIIELFRRYF